MFTLFVSKARFLMSRLQIAISRMCVFRSLQETRVVSFDFFIFLVVIPSCLAFGCFNTSDKCMAHLA